METKDLVGVRNQRRKCGAYRVAAPTIKRRDLVIISQERN